MVLDGQHYLHRLRSACILQPEWNRHHLAALDHIFAIAARADSLEAFLEQTSQLADLIAANHLDRAANLNSIAQRHDAPWLGMNSDVVEIPAAIQRLFSSLLSLKTLPVDPPAIESAIHQSFHQLRALDPDFEPYRWHLQPRYHRRLPWAPGILHQWLEPLWNQYPNTARPIERPPIPVPGHLLPYEGPWPEAPPIEVAPVEPVLRDQSRWPDEILHAHDLETARLLQSARTPIALEAISVERDLARSILACHNRLHLSTLLAPFRAALAGFPIKPALDITGLAASELLAHPRVQFFFEHNLKPNLATNLDGFGAFDGEAGFDVLLLAQAQPSFDFRHCLSGES